jgi:ribosomal protein S18 acetylase RimI-like enzyme
VEPRWPDPVEPGDLSHWRLGQVPYGHPDVLRLVEEVQAIYVERYGSPDETPLDPLMFEPPTGSFFVGYLDGEPVASGAWRRTTAAVVPGLGPDDLVAEVKRMYVAPRAQRRGLARRVLAHLEATAAASGVRALVLETGTAQPEAIALYESAGYTPVAGFGHYRDSPLSRCFGRVLPTAPPQPL